MTDAKPFLRGTTHILSAGLFTLALTCMIGCEQEELRTRVMIPSTQSAAPACYFIVVPLELPNGSPTDTQRKSLERWMADRAGGYTRLGPCHGGWRDGDRIVEEDHVAYFLRGPAGLKPELERIITEEFQQREPFVVPW